MLTAISVSRAICLQWYYILGARQVFERWMEWEPDEQAWHSYINFELRYKELDRARAIYERYILLSSYNDFVVN